MSLELKPMSEGAGKTFNLRILLVIAISALVLVGILGVFVLHNVAFTNYAKEEALHRMNDSAEAIATKAERLLEPARVIARQVLDRAPSHLGSEGWEGRQVQFDRFLEGMDIVRGLHPHISAVYLGYPDGSIASLTQNSPELLSLAGLSSELASPYLRMSHNAADPAAIDVWSYEVDGVWQTVDVPTFGYDPRKRPWYQIAHNHRKPIWTGLYRFLTDSFGITLTAALRDGNGNLTAVLGVDIRLDDLTGFVREIDVTPNSFVFIAQRNGELIAHPALDMQTLDNDMDSSGPTLFEVRREDKHDVRLFDAFAGSEDETIQVIVGGETILGRRLALSDQFDLNADLFIGAPLSDFTDAAEAVKRSTLWIVAAMTLAVVVVGVLIARAVARPIQRAAETMNAISRLDLMTPLPSKPSALAEIQTLNTSVTMMQTALSSFTRYVPGDLVRSLLDLRQPLELGGMRREITVLFTDIEGFTRLTETEQHEQMINGLADYFDIIAETIAEHGGTLDKFIGDAVMAFWGAPGDDPEHTNHACDAVLDIMRRLEAFNRERLTAGKLPLQTRLALHRGYAFVGNVGARHRFGYTALGDVVNTAARLERAAKELGVQGIVSRDVAMNSDERHQFLSLGEVQLRGKTAMVEAFKFEALIDNATNARLDLAV
ncbi:MAG: adenylate/guanylate cyclase domain-containing protein [Pseudomonadota bacterium]